MRIVKEKTAALIIDVQSAVLPVIWEHEKLVKNVTLLVEGLKIIGIPVFVTEQFPNVLGPTAEPVSTALGPVKRIEKQAFSCCDEPRLMEGLAVAAKEYIIVAGIESHICVLQTVLDLKRNGYNPVIVEDCISSRKYNDKKISVHRMKQEGALVTTVESLLFELNPAFFSKYVAHDLDLLKKD